MKTFYPPHPQPHTCPLPWQSGGYGSTGCPDGTLAWCDDCDRWWVSVPAYESLGPTTKWVKVRWWRRTAWKQVKLIRGEDVYFL